jgi:N-acetylglucosaminyldiphosphoundecaprenol N-acetyl-beta-D-mannosaminyltransferase
MTTFALEPTAYAQPELEVRLHEVLLPTVSVSGFALADVSREALVQGLVDGWQRSSRAVTCFALHVGGLRMHADETFVKTMNSSAVTYADGVSAVMLARLEGAVAIERAPTTDLGWALVAELSERLGRRAKVALIGGRPGLALQAAAAIAQAASADVVYTSNGYQRDWSRTLAHLRRSKPDLIFVGLGMPLEAEWVIRHESELPASLVVTCGGWFGFLAGEETRAPVAMQRMGLEWTWRFAQSPRRLASRYVHGSWVLLRLMAQARLRQRAQQAEPVAPYSVPSRESSAIQL